MNQFEVRYSEEAKLDLADIYSYISDELHEPKTAENLIKRLMSVVSDLSFMADSYHIYDVEPFSSQGFRYFSEGKYSIFYKIQKNTAFVVRIINGTRNIPDLL
ncbi:MAG: type II toxin-antitoxin system RelE/ParE family toxin [Treponema sp.]|nr:type II toxin-antitoxin system RelE/ParE family toxin [Treponema sp.]